MSRAQVIDDKLLDEILKEICNALMYSDVNIKYVMELRKKVNVKLKEHMEAQADAKNAGNNLRRTIVEIVVDELTKMLGSENAPYEP